VQAVSPSTVFHNVMTRIGNNTLDKAIVLSHYANANPGVAALIALVGGTGGDEVPVLPHCGDAVTLLLLLLMACEE
jgi:hypothetical protein